MERETRDNGVAAPLTVARIPALVREVDVIVQTLAASRLPTDPEDVVSLCESLLARIEEIDEFRQTLRAGPLEAIVQKQVVRLSAVLESLHRVGSKATAKAQNDPQQAVLVDTRHKRQIVPVPGSLLVKRVSSHHIRPGSASKQLTVRLPRHPKPIYKWEKRRPITMSSSQHAPPGFLDDDANEASMELQPCREPGHYVRSSMAFKPSANLSRDGFCFQIVLTEAEVQGLKFQRRQLQAEQRHLTRQQPKTSS